MQEQCAMSNKSSAVNKLLSKTPLDSGTADKSWYEEVVDHESEIMEINSKSALYNSKIENDTTILSQSMSSQYSNDVSRSFASDGKDESNLSNSSNRLVKKDREIMLEFLDSSNEEKYERLLKEEKIKTPLKRRLSSNSNSRSNSPFLDDTNTSMSNSNDDSNNELYYSKKTRIDSEGTFVGHDSKQRKYREYEDCEEVLSRRQKQIDYGKNTVGYDNYTRLVPRDQRTSEHPWTPPKHHKYSRRAFDGLVKVWRKKLHCFDPAGMKKANSDKKMVEESSSSDDEDAAINK